MHRESRERSPRHRIQRKPLVSDHGMHHSTWVTHVSWCMSESLTRGGGENVPGFPGACVTRHFTYLVRGPSMSAKLSSVGVEIELLLNPMSGKSLNFVLKRFIFLERPHSKQWFAMAFLNAFDMPKFLTSSCFSVLWHTSPPKVSEIYSIFITLPIWLSIYWHKLLTICMLKLCLEEKVSNRKLFKCKCINVK